MSDSDHSDTEVAKAATPKAKGPSSTGAKSKVKEVKSKVKSDAPASKDGPTHPKYSDMIIGAIREIKSRKGCSRAAILKSIKETHELGDNDRRIALSVSLALKRGVEKGIFKTAREGGKGSHSYKLGDNAENKPKKSIGVKKTKPKKTAAKEGVPVVKKSASTKSKEKASAKRSSVGTPVRKVAKKAAGPKLKVVVGKKTDKKPSKTASKTAAAKPSATAAKKAAGKKAPAATKASDAKKLKK